MARFPKNDIISLIGEMPRYDLGESVGPDLRLSDVLDRSAQPSFGEMALGYGTAQGDPRLRTLIADAHGVSTDDVVVTMGGMHALFLVAFVLCERGDEAVTVSPISRWLATPRTLSARRSAPCRFRSIAATSSTPPTSVDTSRSEPGW